AALLGDVAADAAVAEEFAVAAQARLAGDDVDLARAARVAARDLEVEERQPRGEALAVRAERAGADLDPAGLADALAEGRGRAQRAGADLDAGDLPEALAEGRRRAEEGRHRPAARQPGDAVLCVGLPEPVGGKLGQAAEALLARLQVGRPAPLAQRGEVHDE